MRCPRIRSDDTAIMKMPTSPLQQNNFLDSFGRHAPRALPPIGEKITFYFISFHSRVCTFTLLSLLMHTFDSWIVISVVKHKSIVWQWMWIDGRATSENGFAQQRINICFVNRELCATGANAIQNRSNRKFLSRCRRRRHASQWMFYFIWIGIMASRHSAHNEIASVHQQYAAVVIVNVFVQGQGHRATATTTTKERSGIDSEASGQHGHTWAKVMLGKCTIVHETKRIK